VGAKLYNNRLSFVKDITKAILWYILDINKLFFDQPALNNVERRQNVV